MTRVHLRRPSDRVLNVLVVTGAAIAVLFTATMSAAANTTMSPYDEAAHFDYVVKVSQGNVFPHVGSLYSETTIKELSCRGSAGYLGVDLRCKTPLQPQEMPFQDVNYVLNYAPLYYGIAAVIAKVVVFLTPFNLFVGARLASVLLYTAGTVLFSISILRLGARRILALGIPLLVFTLPGMIYQGSTVTPDSMSLLAGAAGLFVLTLKTTWRRRMIIALVVAILIALVKANNVPLATLTVLIAAVFPGTTDNESGKARWISLGWKRILLSIVAAALPVLLSFGVNRLRNLSLPPGTSPDGGIGAFLTTNDPLVTLIVDSARTLSGPLTIASYTDETLLATAATAIQFLLLGGVAAVCVVGALDPKGTARTLAFGAFASLVLSIVFLPTTFYILSHASGTQQRYSIPLVPIYAAAFALVVTERRAANVVTLVGLGVFVASASDLLALLTV